MVSAKLPRTVTFKGTASTPLASRPTRATRTQRMRTHFTHTRYVRAFTNKFRAH